MENKENTLNGVIPKPKIRVVKKVIRKKPPMTSDNSDPSTNKLNEQLSNLKLDSSNNSTTTNNTTNTTINTLNKPNVQKKSDILKKSIKEKIHFDKLTYDAQMSLIEDETTENELRSHYVCINK